MILNIESPKLKQAQKRKIKEEKIEHLTKPHRWFAWYPVRVSDTEVAFLTYVTRTAIVSYVWDPAVCRYATPKISVFTYSK